ncbi:hypothetical protein HAX54_016511 [Datura stramonium]|uniref:Uncharacterized protein n=1 Tax=Datura stramonium TaxID=4076 RepID=A0ABS8S061_DATST|nr:hypothetical protein [Datura stramonium]
MNWESQQKDSIRLQRADVVAVTSVGPSHFPSRALRGLFLEQDDAVLPMPQIKLLLRYAMLSPPLLQQDAIRPLAMFQVNKDYKQVLKQQEAATKRGQAKSEPLSCLQATYTKLSKLEVKVEFFRHLFLCFDRDFENWPELYVRALSSTGRKGNNRIGFSKSLKRDCQIHLS